MGFSALTGSYWETGTQNVAGGVSVQVVDSGPSAISTLGVGARFARQVGTTGDWRAYTRTSFGIGPCQVSSCEPMRDQERYAFEAQLGLARMFWKPGAAPQDDPGMAAEFGVIYTRASDSDLGEGHFIGLGIGLTIGINYFREKPDGTK
jgi:hypothetical protein